MTPLSPVSFSRLEGLGARALLLYTLALALVMEAVTLFFRFGLHLESTRDTRFLAGLTFGIRIHHGYVGLLMVLLAFIPARGAALRNGLILLGGALLLSDLIHHFLVLWPITGSPEFDLSYSSAAG